jgi:hypothetical protein
MRPPVLLANAKTANALPTNTIVHQKPSTTFASSSTGRDIANTTATVRSSPTSIALSQASSEFEHQMDASNM